MGDMDICIYAMRIELLCYDYSGRLSYRIWYRIMSIMRIQGPVTLGYGLTRSHAEGA